MQGLAQRGIIKGQITSQRAHGHLEATRKPADYLLGPCNQWPHLAAITGGATWQIPRKDTTRNHVGTEDFFFAL